MKYLFIALILHLNYLSLKKVLCDTPSIPNSNLIGAKNKHGDSTRKHSVNVNGPRRRKVSLFTAFLSVMYYLGSCSNLCFND